MAYVLSTEDENRWLISTEDDLSAEDDIIAFNQDDPSVIFLRNEIVATSKDDFDAVYFLLSTKNKSDVGYILKMKLFLSTK